MTFWRNLSLREKMIIAVGFPLMAALVFYLYFWEPYYEEVRSLRVTVPEKRATLEWMKHEIAQAGPWLSQPKSDDQSGSSPILTVIESRAIASRVKDAIQRVQPSSGNQVKIWFEDVSASSWFKFVDLLSKDGVSVESATLTRSSPGLVNIRVTFYR